jgi:hypothetical protein
VHADPEIVAKYGVDYSYDLCPRANIFRRDQGNVVDMTTFQDIMRYNDYTKDPYSCVRGAVVWALRSF